MQTPKDNCLNNGRDDITQPGLFVYAPRAPEHGHEDCGWQCLFGGKHHVVQQYISGGWIQAGVWRDSEKDVAELRTIIHMTEGGKQETYLKLSADDMQTLACALLDAAHHLRTVPAVPYVYPVAAVVKADAEAVPA
jgi:hypothetical protein